MKRICYIFSLALLLLTGCNKFGLEAPDSQTTTPVPPTEGDKVAVNFTVRFDLAGMTKAMGHEPDIRSMRVAVFGSSGFLKEYVEATLATAPAGGYKNYNEANNYPEYTYQVHLSFSDKARIVHFIANGPESLPFDSEDTVIANALVEGDTDAYWQRLYLADGITAKQVWNEETQRWDYVMIPNTTYYAMSDQTSADFQHIPLIRNFAEIEVASEATKFTLISSALMNEPASGCVAPYRGEDGFFTTKLPSHQQKEGDKSYEAYTYETIVDDYEGWMPASVEIDTSVPAATDFTDGKKYVYERPVSKTNPTWLLVYGTYTDANNPGDNGNYYYKIFLNDEYNQPLTLYRNFTYKIMISEVTRPGYATPTAAAQGAGSGDISASVSADVPSVSDGAATLSIQPKTEYTFAEGGKVYGVIKFSFYDATGTLNDDVEVETRSWNAAGAVIDGSSVGTDDGITISTSDDDEGFRTLTFTTTASGAATKTQVIRISGTRYNAEHHPIGTLYRDVTLNLIAKQNMTVICNPDTTPGEVESGMGKDADGNIIREVLVRMMLPDNLPHSIFPLAMKIESSTQSLNPEPMEGSNMPVQPGVSLSTNTEEPNYGKSTFYFIRTITYDEYCDATVSDGNRLIDSMFYPVKENSACTVWVDNDYFNTASAPLANYTMRYFSNLSMALRTPAAGTTSRTKAEGDPVPVTFSFGMDPAEYENVEVTLKMKGVYYDVDEETKLTPVSNVDGVYTYTYKGNTVSPSFKLLEPDPTAEITITLSALHYETATYEGGATYEFGTTGFVTSNNDMTPKTQVSYKSGKTVYYMFTYDSDDTDHNPVTLTAVGLTSPTIAAAQGSIEASTDGTYYTFKPAGPRRDSYVITWTTLEASVGATSSVTISSGDYKNRPTASIERVGSVTVTLNTNSSTITQTGNNRSYTYEGIKISFGNVVSSTANYIEYKTTDNGGNARRFTVSTDVNGRTITKITLNFERQSGTVSVNTGSYSNRVWTGRSNSIQFNNTTTTGQQGNNRLISIDVEYED